MLSEATGTVNIAQITHGGQDNQLPQTFRATMGPPAFEWIKWRPTNAVRKTDAVTTSTAEGITILDANYTPKT